MEEEKPSYIEPTPAIPVKHPEQQDFWRFSAELIRTALIVSVLAYLIRIFILQPYVVEGSSMAPRFHTNDFLIVDKLSYRLTEPQRGDIIVFKYPNDESVNYVKRIMGLPGETIKIENSIVTIFNNDHPDGFQINEPYLDTDTITTLPAGSKSEFVVPADSYFVMGDNRQASSDSREWGMLPKKDLIGRVILQAYPFDRASFVGHARYENN